MLTLTVVCLQCTITSFSLTALEVAEEAYAQKLSKILMDTPTTIIGQRPSSQRRLRTSRRTSEDTATTGGGGGGGDDDSTVVAQPQLSTTNTAAASQPRFWNRRHSGRASEGTMS